MWPLYIWLTISGLNFLYSFKGLMAARQDRDFIKRNKINSAREVVSKMLLRASVFRLTIAAMALVIGFSAFFHNSISSFIITYGLISLQFFQMLIVGLDLRDRERISNL